MPPKKGAAEGSKPALTPTGRVSRKGRFTALPRKKPIDEKPYKLEDETKVEDLTSTSQEKVATSTSSTPRLQTSQNVTKSTQLSLNGDQPATTLSRPDAITASNKIFASSAVEVPLPTSQSSIQGSDQLQQSHIAIDSMKDSLNDQLSVSKAPKLPRSTTPDIQSQERSDSSSSLSSVPESLGSTPQGLTARQQCLRNQTNQGASPVRRSSRARKRSIAISESDVSQSSQKKRKVTHQVVLDILPSIEESPAASSTIADAAPSDSFKRSTRSSTDSLATKRKNHDFDDDVDSSTQPRNKRPRISDEGYGTLSPDKASSLNSQPLPPKSPEKLSKAQEARDERYKARLAKEILRSESSAPVRQRRSCRNKVVAHGSDTQTQHNSASVAEPARRGGKTNGRGAARGGRGGAGGGRGRSNKGRGKGRDEDSPEPPQPKKPQSQQDATIIRQMKARQVELRKFFTIVGNQQGEILDVISSQHLTRIVKKAKSHRQVPEHDEIVQQLEDLRDFRKDLVRREYEFAVAAEMARYEAEKEVLERSLKTQVGDFQDEYTKGAQGDILIFRRATAMAQDETTTQDGSEMDFLPRYNDFPDPNQSIRGYTSGRFMDEKPFKHHLLTYDDQARREVIGDDIVGPSIQRFVQKTRDEREAEARRKTQTIDALANVAEKELQGVNDSLNVGFMALPEDMHSKCLSMLADASELHAEHYRGKQYSFVSLGHGDAFPSKALNFDRPPGYGIAVPQPPVPQPYQEISTAQRAIATKPPPPPTHSSRRSLRNLQPNGPVSTPQSQPTPPATTNPTPAPSATVASGSGQTLAPAPPRLAPAFSTQHSRKPRPAPIDTKSQNPTPPERSPVQTASTQPQIQPSSGLPPIQPRHMSQTSLPPPPPPPPHYGYPPQFSPTHAPPPQYAQHPHHNVPLTYPYPQSSPYHHLQHGMPPSPYMQHNPQYQPYVPAYYPHQPPPPQQQFAFLPPQQGPAQSQALPATRPHSRSQSNATPSTPTNTAPSQGLPPPPPQQLQHHQQQQNNDGYGQNGFHMHPHNQHQHQPPQQPHLRTLSHPHQNPPPHAFQQQQQQQQPPPPPPPPSQTQTAPPPPHNPLPTPIHTTSTGKSRARAKAKQPVTFVNQTLATRKAAAEALARDEAQATAERKEKERVTKRDNVGSGNGRSGTPGNSDGRKLAPKP